jgi:hypothetical protein
MIDRFSTPYPQTYLEKYHPGLLGFVLFACTSTLERWLFATAERKGSLGEADPTCIIKQVHLERLLENLPV